MSSLGTENPEDLSVDNSCGTCGERRSRICRRLFAQFRFSSKSQNYLHIFLFSSPWLHLFRPRSSPLCTPSRISHQILGIGYGVVDHCWRHAQQQDHSVVDRVVQLHEDLAAMCACFCLTEVIWEEVQQGSGIDEAGGGENGDRAVGGEDRTKNQNGNLFGQLLEKEGDVGLWGCRVLRGAGT